MAIFSSVWVNGLFGFSVAKKNSPLDLRISHEQGMAPITGNPSPLRSSSFLFHDFCFLLEEIVKLRHHPLSSIHVRFF
jgi:hypothetical protein